MTCVVHQVQCKNTNLFIDNMTDYASITKNMAHLLSILQSSSAEKREEKNDKLSLILFAFVLHLGFTEDTEQSWSRKRHINIKNL